MEKLESLLKASPEARITLVAPDIRQEIIDLTADKTAIKLIQRKFEEADLDGKNIVIMATDDKQLHRDILPLAHKRNILCNVADTPDFCDFYLGSIVNKGEVKIAISTNGKSPTVAKRLREILEEAVPDEMEELLKNLQILRSRMTGDFAFKVKELNRITSKLVEKRSASWREKLRRIRFSREQKL